MWTRGALRQLAPGILSGLPDGVLPILRSGLVSPLGIARASLDLVLPRANDGTQDQSVGSMIRKRLGNESAERMIDPLLGGIYGGDPDQLSLQATAPRLAALAKEHRSLIHGLIATGRRAPVPSGAPMFKTLPGGLERIISALRSNLQMTDVVCNEGVRSLTQVKDGGYQLHTSAGRILQADGVILALPAYRAAELLHDLSPAASNELHQIAYNPITVIWLAFEPDALPPLPTGSGFLVPRADQRMISACTWASAKWSHLADGDRVLLRCSVGRGREDTLTLNDEALVRGVVADLRAAIGVHDDPAAVLVTRFDRAMPQYTVGHLERVARLEQAMTGLPRLKIAGAAFSGIGIPQCITQGEKAAGTLAAELWQKRPSGDRQPTPTGPVG
ncbi:MAG: protoporphyrinogen oxidase [Solirubrobacteraceae bacterium]